MKENALLTVKFLKGLVIHMRPYLLFISGVAGLAGMSIAEDFQLLRFESLLAFVAFFLSYGFGQALTDCFQVDTDKISAPYRPLSQGTISPKLLGFVSTIGLVLLSSIFVILSPWNLLLCLLIVIGLYTYTFFKRKYWSIGPFYNGWIVALLPIMGYSVVVEGGPFLPHETRLILLFFLTFFSYTTFVLIGYLKDIEADRQSGYRTFPVVLGWDASVWTANILATISTLLMVFLCYEVLSALLFGIFGTLLIFRGQAFALFLTEKVEKNAAFPIAMTVRAFILWHLAVLVSARPNMWIFGLVYFVLFEWILMTRPMREQI